MPEPFFVTLSTPSPSRRTPENAPAAEVLAVAVVDDPKEPRVKLYEGRHNQGERSIHPHPEGNTEAFTECASIYAGKLPPCDVLKIDAEGSARKILEKYRHLATCKAVLVEWDSQPEYLWMRKHLHEQGFRCIVDRARGMPSPHRELCFVHRKVMLDGKNGAES